VSSQYSAERIAAAERAQHAWLPNDQQPGRKFAAQCVARVDGKPCGRDFFAAVHTLELPAARCKLT
jgi:hypothetical protein